MGSGGIGSPTARAAGPFSLVRTPYYYYYYRDPGPLVTRYRLRRRQVAPCPGEEALIR